MCGLALVESNQGTTEQQQWLDDFLTMVEIVFGAGRLHTHFYLFLMISAAIATAFYFMKAT